MSFTSAPFPAKDAIVAQGSLRPTKVLIDWVTTLASDVDQAPARLTTVTLTGQSASIGTTAFTIGVLAAGFYRVTPYARITQAGTVSSSLTVTLGWTESALALTADWAAVTGNTTGSVLTGPPALILVDQGTAVSYSTTYASAGATAMQYRLSLTVEQVDA